MPDLWTHKIAGDIIRTRLRLNFTEEEKLYNYFLQGPDVFLFTKKLNRFSWILHKEHPGKFLEALFKNCSYPPLLLGFLSHFDIDRFTHPYIIYLAGSDAKLHEKIEFALDNALYQWFYHRLNPSGKEFLRLIPEHFPSFVEDCFRESFIEIYKMPCPTRFFGSSLEGFVKFYKDILFENPFTDILNLKKEEWLNPYTGERFNYSFIELIEMANSVTISNISFFLEKKQPPKIPDVSYYTNIHYTKNPGIIFTKMPT